MTAPDLLSPQELAQYLLDAGEIHPLTKVSIEQRMTAWAEKARAEGRVEGIGAALRKAETVVRLMRGERQKDAARKVLGALRGLLPEEKAAQMEIAKARSEGYRHGYRDGKRN